MIRLVRSVFRLYATLFVAGVSALMAGCQEELEFTSKPGKSVVKAQAGVVRTPVFVVSKADISQVQAEIDRRLPNQIIRYRKRLRRAACVVKDDRRRCFTALVSGEVVRAGPARIAPLAGGFDIQIPMHYTFEAAGRGRARNVRTSVQGDLVLRAAYSVRVDENWQPHVRFANRMTWGTPTEIKILDGTLKTARDIERKLKSRLRRLAREIEGAVDMSGAAKSVADAWRQLHYPVQLSRDDDVWVRGEPSAVRFGGLTVVDGGLEVRIAIMTELKTYVGERPVPLIAQPMPPIEVEAPASTTSRLMLPVDLAYSEVVTRLKDILAKRGPIKTDGAGEVKSFTVTDVEIYPAAGRLALRLALEADTGSKWGGLKGNAYITAAPYVPKGQTSLALRFAEFTAHTPSPSLFEDGVFIVPEKPFVDAFRKALGLGLKERFADVLANSNRSLRGRFGSGQRIRGRFDDLAAHSVHVGESGLRINLALEGALSIYAAGLPVSAQIEGTSQAQ